MKLRSWFKKLDYVTRHPVISGWIAAGCGAVWALRKRLVDLAVAFVDLLEKPVTIAVGWVALAALAGALIVLALWTIQNRRRRRARAALESRSRGTDIKNHFDSLDEFHKVILAVARHEPHNRVDTDRLAGLLDEHGLDRVEVIQKLNDLSAHQLMRWDPLKRGAHLTDFGIKLCTTFNIGKR